MSCREKFYWGFNAVGWAVVIAFFVFLFASCESGLDGGEALCAQGSILPLNEPWGETEYSLELVQGLSGVSEDARLWRYEGLGYLLFEHFHQNGNAWDRVVIYAEPIGPCHALAFYLQGRGTGYHVRGLITLSLDTVTIQIFARAPGGAVWEIYRYLSYQRG
jgi:hypothetical protein